MDVIGWVSAIVRYPVKSMGGERLEVVEIGERGLMGDRAWAVRDEVRGGLRGAKNLPRLMQLRARYAVPPVRAGSSPAEIMFLDGTVVSTADVSVSERLSAALGHPVTLWPLLPAEALDHYRRGAPTHADIETELRAIFGRTRDEPLPDLSVFPRELLTFESPPGTYFDAYSVLLLTVRALDSMRRAHPERDFDVRRFRPNLLIDTADESAPFPEDAWLGRRLRVGEAVLRARVACPRCVMTTHGFDDAPADPGVMRALVKETGGHLGVYAEVEVPGTVRAGDAIEVEG